MDITLEIFLDTTIHPVKDTYVMPQHSLQSLLEYFQ